MVTIKNKEISCSLFIGMGENGQSIMKEVKTNIFTQIQMIMQSPKPNGLTTEQMRKYFRVLDAVEIANKNKEDLKLEDADYDVLVSEIKIFQYATPNKNAIEFEDYILDAKK